MREKRVVNDINGLIILDKPKDHTSNDCLSIIKKYLHPKKLGHTGTLDENATGVLVCLLGSATKSQEYLMKTGDKVYDAEIVLGISTDTEDITGKIIEFDGEIREKFDINKLEDIVKSFIGNYDQVPPMYSSKKIGGKKLLNLARKGIAVERKACKVLINNIEVVKSDNYKYDFDDKQLVKARLLVNCSKGTYIRTLCKDIGEKLGLPSCMGNLRRLRTGEFKIEDSITLDMIKKFSECGDLSFIKPCYYQEENSVVTFGKYETLHLGHQKIINQVVNDARENKLKSIVIIVGNTDNSKILSKEQRISKLKLMGVDKIINFELSDINMKMCAETFVEEVLIKQLKAKEVVVGSDCRFGYKGIGDSERLATICKKYGVQVKIVEKIKFDNIDISSTLIKYEFDKGNIDIVKRLLGK